MRATLKMSLKFVLKDIEPERHPEFIKLVQTVRHDLRVPEKELNAGSLHRFYHSNFFDFGKTLAHLKSHLKWRKSYLFPEAINLDKNSYDVIAQHAAIGLYGNTRAGNPIGYIKGKTDYPFQALHILKEEKIIAYQVQLFERLVNIIFPMCSQKYQRNINRIVCVIDLQNRSYLGALADFALFRFALSNMEMYRTNYPELNLQSIVINMNPLFVGVWNVIARYMMPRTVGKFSFYSDDYLPALLELTDINNIPKEYGGQCPYEIEAYPNFWNEELAKSVVEKRLTRND